MHFLILVASQKYFEKVNIRCIHGTAGFWLVEALAKLAIKTGVIHDGVGIDTLRIKEKSIGILDADPETIFWTLPNKLLSKKVQINIKNLEAKPINGSNVGIYSENGFNIKNAHYLLSYSEDPIYE